MNKKVDVNIVIIDDARVNQAINSYFLWKEVNTYLKAQGCRGLNIPEGISEPIVCYALNLGWNRGKIPGDATDPKSSHRIEIKASSSATKDLTSFGPKTSFDELIFVSFDLSKDEAYIYRLPYTSNDINSLQASKKETVGMQRQDKRRPRISIIQQLVKPNNHKPTVTVNLRTKTFI